MNKIIFFLTALFFLSCEKPSDCIEESGEVIAREISIDMPTSNDSINKIFIEKGVELIVKHGPFFKITIQAGENFIDKIEVKREGKVLYIKENSACNWVREFGQSKVYVTTPKLEEIYSKSDRNISSDGVLKFPSLRLYSYDKEADFIEGAGTGDFFINVENSRLDINSNNVSRFFINGKTDYVYINFPAGDSRMEAPNFEIQNCQVYHRGSNDMILKPIQSIIGQMVSTGNIILKSNPPIVNVEQLYLGQIIFE